MTETARRIVLAHRPQGAPVPDDFRLEETPLPEPAADEVVVRGDLDGKVFRAYWVRDGRVVAAMHANDWDASSAIREAVESGELPPE